MNMIPKIITSFFYKVNPNTKGVISRDNKY
jgi:hypothetical protein